MVPGSVLRYPSHFMGTILRWLERRRPMEAEAIPLPSPERTPPVMTMYFGAVEDFFFIASCD